MRHGILVPLTAIKPASLAIEDKVLTTGPPGRSLLIILTLSLQIILLWLLLPFDLPCNFLLKGRNVLDNKNWVKWDAIWKFILKCLRVYLLLKFPATICIIVNIIHIILLLKNPWHFLLLLFFLFFSAFLTSVDLDFCKLSSEKKFMFGFPLWLRW